jgi:Rrf2 family protein
VRKSNEIDGFTRHMRISATADYAVRAAAELVGAPDEKPLTAAQIASSQGISASFLPSILRELTTAGIIQSSRGYEGGYRLDKPADQITIADIIRAVDGPLASVRGTPPETTPYSESTLALQRVWIAVRKNLREVLEQVTIADVAAGQLPTIINELLADPDAWTRR